MGGTSIWPMLMTLLNCTVLLNCILVACTTVEAYCRNNQHNNIEYRNIDHIVITYVSIERGGGGVGEIKHTQHKSANS